MTTSKNSNRPGMAAPKAVANSTAKADTAKTEQAGEGPASEAIAEKTAAPEAVKTTVKPAAKTASKPAAETSGAAQKTGAPSSVGNNKVMEPKMEPVSDHIADQIKVFPRRRVWPD
ncbi:hypothetical protein [Thiomicrorhabdus cannonii]|uniref:hypothetical protein n=1 Tax=Thiomicrorhabdus cannonii TaxID=2748011 RepID=UPI0015BB6BA2|nr:hypothetical protein [Thiomicrorhabdus cannonii]